jgi:peptidoglycan/LPS O-acetylase OafA/YrhL
MSDRETRFPSLDGVRGLAAFLVVCTHVGFISGRSFKSDVLGPILSRGDFGVALFFLLSGFLLYRPFAAHALGLRPRPSVRRFVWRRLLRIAPAMALFVVITLAFLTPYRVRASDYLQYLLLIQTYDHHDYDPNLAHLWTLAIEVSFYLLLPLLASIGAGGREDAKSSRRTLAVLCVMLVATPAFTLYQLKFLQGTQALLWLPAYTDWFALGMGLAFMTCLPPDSPTLLRVRRTLTSWAGSPGTCWALAVMCYLITTLPVGNPRTLAPALYWQWTVQHCLYGVTAFFIMLPLTMGSHPRIDAVLGSWFARFAGNISYGVYLWHVPLMPRVQSALGFKEFDGHFEVLLVVTLLSGTAAASASWFILERPLLRRYSSVSWRRAEPSTVTHSAARQSS